MMDLAKSMFRFSWALSLFSARQAVDLMTGQSRRTADDFEAVRYAAQGQMEGPFRSLFEAGDRVQRGMVDLAAGVLGQTRKESPKE
jgi:hypothetical protein